MTRQKSKNTQPDQKHPMLPKKTTSPEIDSRKSNRANRFANKFAYPTAAGGKKEKEVDIASVGDTTPAAGVEHLRVSGGVKDADTTN